MNYLGEREIWIGISKEFGEASSYSEIHFFLMLLRLLEILRRFRWISSLPNPTRSVDLNFDDNYLSLYIVLWLIVRILL